MKKTLAIDIGSHSIKLIELQEKKAELEIIKACMNFISGDNVKPALKDLVDIAKPSLKRVNVSLSGPSVIVRYIEMPLMKKEELKSAIKFEAEKYLPFSVNDAIIDCAMLDKSPSGGQRVLLVAAKKERVDYYMDMFKEVGLDIDIIDVDSFALFNAFQRVGLEKKEESTYAIINIGAKFSNMNIITKGNAYFTRDVLWGGADITNRIRDSRAINFQDAEALKLNPSEKKDEIISIITPVLEKLMSEVRISFDYFEAQFGKNIEKVYISGGTSYLSNIVEFLKNNMALDVLVWNPFDGIKIEETNAGKELKEIPSAFAVAMGLGLR